jgi:DNA polymerase
MVSVARRAPRITSVLAPSALLGAAFRVTRDRGKSIPSPLAPHVVATVHPSSILRVQDEEQRRREMDAFVECLARVAALLR